MNTIPIWGAVSREGKVIKSSVGTYREVANRWAARYKNFEVQKLGEVKLPNPGRTIEEARAKRGPGRPRKYPIVD